MPVIINQSEDRVLLRFNSGVTRTLGPHEELQVEHVEVKGNDRILRLESRRRIAIQRDDGRGRGRGRSRAAAAEAGAGAEGGGDEGEAAEAKGEGRRRPRRRKSAAEAEAEV